jgi:diguanylate cyclase (GGDEF)-like protein
MGVNGPGTARVQVLRPPGDPPAQPPQPLIQPDDRQTVLLIDQGADLLAMLGVQLRELGVELLHAHNGRDGLEQALRRRPDVVLLDHELPDVDGLQVLQQMHARAELCDAAIVFLTAAEDDHSQLHAFQHGAVDFVRKPCRAAELRARVQAVLRTRALLRRLERQASRDRLTGMLNRGALLVRLEQTLARAATRPDGSYAVLFLDFDSFKLLNDAYGHDAGDELLRQVGERLHAITRTTDAVLPTAAGNTTARFGGDEFVVVLEDLPRPEEALRVAERLLDALSSDYWIFGNRVTSSVSIGIVHGSSRYRAAGDVLRDADAAMYEAKAAGRGRYAVFDSSMSQRIRFRVDTERELRAAIDAQQLTLVYQPIVSLQEGDVVGIEALLRWEHPVKGVIPPAQFLPVAVESGLIKPIGEWVVHRACRDFVNLRQAMGAAAPEFVSVNVSRKQLTDLALPSKLAAVLAETALEGSRLHLEITESELVTNFSIAQQTLAIIKRLGVSIAVDDFGTGYSSLASLHQFPIDVFKLDRSFMTPDVSGTSGRAVIAVAHAMIQLARNLGVRVIAEGVETAAQLAVLHSLQCDMAQGYYLAAPMPIDALPGWRLSSGCHGLRRPAEPPAR